MYAVIPAVICWQIKLNKFWSCSKQRNLYYGQLSANEDCYFISFSILDKTVWAWKVWWSWSSSSSSTCSVRHHCLFPTAVCCVQTKTWFHNQIKMRFSNHCAAITPCGRRCCGIFNVDNLIVDWNSICLLPDRAVWVFFLLQLQLIVAM